MRGKSSNGFVTNLFRIDIGTLERLAKMQKASGLTAPMIVRDAINQFIDRWEREQAPASQPTKMIEAQKGD